LVMN